jgi:hypothetical protein
MHWSADPAVARKFAGPFGHVLHGEIPMSSVETDTNRLRSEQVLTPERDRSMSQPEKEVSATIGKPVKVTGMTGPEADPKTGAWNGRRNESTSPLGAKRPPRKRTYKKPKDMTA